MEGCASTKIQLDALSVKCYGSIPPELKTRVPGVSILTFMSTVGDLASKLDEQTANLETANNHTEAVLEITRKCDERNQDIAAKLKK